MKQEKELEIYRLILLKVLCYKQNNGKYIIHGHDELNTNRTIDQIMDIIKVAQSK